MYISGTASINNRGEVEHVGDIIGQTYRMWENVEALLKEADANYDDVTQIIVSPIPLMSSHWRPSAVPHGSLRWNAWPFVRSGTPNTVIFKFVELSPFPCFNVSI